MVFCRYRAAGYSGALGIPLFPQSLGMVQDTYVDTHQIFSHVQGADFPIELKRKTSFQPVGLDAAAQIADNPKGELTTILHKASQRILLI